ncbi:MAG: hypothetical protein J6A19_16760 [Oscillospiraceae bacterium]|nr:hypothetical protein [Oscillospiraceae bacterium]
MLLNLKTEIARRKLSCRKIAKGVDISKEAMSHKITEKSQFTRSEMYAIHDMFFPDTDMKYLFASENEARK